MSRLVRMLRARRARTGAVAPPADPARELGETFELLNIRGMAGRTDNLWRYELVKMAERLGTNPSYHAAVMAIESGFDPAARNPTSNASGLIQLMPFLLKKWGLTPAGVRRMSALDQLELVERFYRPHAGKMKTACDHYLATFMPALVGSPPETVLGEKDSTERVVAGGPTKGAVYKQNIGFDPKPKDGGERKGYFTIADVCVPVNARVAEAEGKPRIVVTPEERPARGGRSGGGIVLLALAVAVPVGVAVARGRS